MVLYEGTEGAKVGEFLDEKCKEAAHDGGVFALTWSPDGQKLATASGDKTVKIWDIASRSLQKYAPKFKIGLTHDFSTIHFGTGLEDQQLAVVWLNKLIVSVSLAGFVNYVDPETWSISKMLKGHNKPITAVALSQDKKFIFTADFEGHIGTLKSRALLVDGPDYCKKIFSSMGRCFGRVRAFFSGGAQVASVRPSADPRRHSHLDRMG